MSVLRDQSFPIWPFVLAGCITFAVLIVGAGGWAARTTLASALVVSGTIESTEQTNVVQHPHGGVVAQVLVRDGDVVAAGDILIELDLGHQAQALHMAEVNAAELAAQIDRLQAQVQGSQAVAFRPELVAQAAEDVEISALLARERRVLDTVGQALADQQAQLRLQNRQTRARLEGLIAQQKAARQQHELIAAALADQRQLKSRGLSQAGTLLGLEQEMVSITGKLGELAARKAEAQATLAEREVQMDALTSTHKSEAAERIAALLPRLRSHERELLDLRRDIALGQIKAPVSGTLQGLAVHHAQAVVPPGQTLATIVPTGATSRVVAQIAPPDIDEVYEGQKVTLRLTALDAQTTPEIVARLNQISARTMTDPRSGQSYFTVEITPDSAEIAALPGDVALTAGMPVEVLINTGSGTPLAFLIKPLADYFARALRES